MSAPGNAPVVVSSWLNLTLPTGANPRPAALTLTNTNTTTYYPDSTNPQRTYSNSYKQLGDQWLTFYKLPAAGQTQVQFRFPADIGASQAGFPAGGAGWLADATCFMKAELLPSGLSLSLDAGQSDSLEGDGVSKTHLSIKAYNNYGDLMVGKTIQLASSGAIPQATLLPITTLLTNADGVAGQDINGNGVLDAGEPLGFDVKTPRDIGDYATITASAPSSSVSPVSKKILIHKISVTPPAATPQSNMVAHDPDSPDTNLSNPPLVAVFSQTPGAAATFKVTLSVCTLDSTTPISTRVFTGVTPAQVSAGWSWSDMFFPSGTPQNQWNGRAQEPGAGLYPWQLEVQAETMKTAVLDSNGIADKNPKASDWKASKSLSFSTRSYALSYDDTNSQTNLTYLMDLTNAKGPQVPQSVQVKAFDPDFQLAGIVAYPATPNPGLSDPSISNKWFYNLQGPITINKAGTYCFVLKAQQPSGIDQGKDWSKWALEQNQSANIPTYVTFGGDSPGIGDRTGHGGLEKISGFTLHTGPASDAVARRLQTKYQVAVRTPAPWWATNRRGVFQNNFTTAQDIAGLPSSVNPNPKTQIMQYNAVWFYAGHGGSGHLMAVWDPAGAANINSNVDWNDSSWSFISTSGSLPVGVANGIGTFHTALSSLPRANRGSFSGGTYSLSSVNPLQYARLVCFIGCDTADFTTSDLPSVAVQLGARNAVGIQRVCPANVIELLSSTLIEDMITYPLHDIYDAAQAASNAAFPNNSSGTPFVRARGVATGSNIFSPAAWGDRIGPEGR